MSGLLLNAFILSISLQLSTPDTQWYTEDYPPFNYQSQGQLHGLAFNVLRTAYQNLDWHMDASNIMLTPWPRAYKAVQQQANSCVFSMTYTESRAKLFNFVGLVIPNTVAVIAHKNSGISIEQLKRDKTLTFGVVKNDIGHQSLLDFGIPESQFVYLKTGLELVRMVDYKRVDLIAYGDAIARYQFKRAKIDPQNYRLLLPLLESKLGYACNKGVPKTLLQRLDKAIKDAVLAQPELLQYHDVDEL
ncbi:ABC transporter substrate-binding protein [Pseudoalteromonas phenolica]|uniref:ABC transporter substrate-binding protein n=1 Tax=Pseudoalteromonas phenolica TaxID=161398 RepID=A0A5R9Q2T5_9GAMM|nr:transporter substrate-binding domain-containing protein [Pseudoalteromonas phenolica]TLX46846.1 ABC transporter substrate-binding protein [Pseudoalteromonas phenolica]